MGGIAEYDARLWQDISSLENYIAEEEELAKLELQNLGCPKEIAEKMAEDDRKKGPHMHFPGAPGYGGVSDELLTLLKNLDQSVETFPFRAYINFKPYIFLLPDLLSIQIITESGEFWLNTTILTNEEKRRFVELWDSSFTLQFDYHKFRIKHCYPSAALMSFMAEMFKKYGMTRLLDKTPTRDERAYDLWSELIELHKSEGDS